MKKFLFLILFCNLRLAYSQVTPVQHSIVDERLFPFYHGVASGDALQDKVIIWTRITNDLPNNQVAWRVATDTNMIDIIKEGVVLTDTSRDNTVKVDVQGLNPDTYYFYEFECEGKYSQRGRFKTLPTTTSEFRLATTSCSSYPHGFFNAYDRITERNDIDAVIHLGDYIYEYGLNQYGNNPERKPEPLKEIKTLGDYRMRHSQYKLDPSLRNLHQQYNFYCIWDDHEFADDAFTNGAVNHQLVDGNWTDRKSMALKAYLEWMPIRTIDSNNTIKIYRKVSIGNLADIFFLDTRMIARDKQSNPDDTSHHLLGETQLQWLKEGLLSSRASWKILAQQVMMAPLTFDLTAVGLPPIVFNNDQWDGYPTERKSLFDFINNNNIKNLVVLTGDIHSAWAMELPFGNAPYKKNGTGSAGVEFVTTSITSPGFPVPADGLLKQIMPHLFWANVTEHGYGILDIRDTSTCNNFYSVNTIERRDAGEKFKASYYTKLDSNHLQKANNECGSSKDPFYQSPYLPRFNSSTPVKPENIIITGIYPNPFTDEFAIQYYKDDLEDIYIEIMDTEGKSIYSKRISKQDIGLYIQYINLPNIATGTYFLKINTKNSIVTRKIEKI